MRSGPSESNKGDPLSEVQSELDGHRYISLPGLPKFTGGAMGYLSYESVRHFEPRTSMKSDGTPLELSDPYEGLPESVWMMCENLIIFDHIYQTIKCVSHVHLPDSPTSSSSSSKEDRSQEIENHYKEASNNISNLVSLLKIEETPLPVQGIVKRGKDGVSNVGEEGYKSFVRALKEHIVAGDIIQAVPSQRLSRPTDLHPFNAYRTLRQTNPSPYMFYLDAGDAQLVGASPETLCKVEGGKVAVHAIAGTVKRGKDDAGE